MKRLHFSIKINASKEKVWKTMLGNETYGKWTAVFMPGSSFDGSWEKGSKVKFLDPSQSGMLGTIAENKPHEFISIKYDGIVNEGKEDTQSPDAKEWIGAQENYTLKDSDGGTELTVDMDVVDSFVDELAPVWPKALQKLKELAEK